MKETIIAAMMASPPFIRKTKLERPVDAKAENMIPKTDTEASQSAELESRYLSQTKREN